MFHIAPISGIFISLFLAVIGETLSIQWLVVCCLVGEHCDPYVDHFKQLFGAEALLSTVALDHK